MWKPYLIDGSSRLMNGVFKGNTITKATTVIVKEIMDRLKPHFFKMWLDRSKEKQNKAPPEYRDGYWDGVADGFEAGVLLSQQGTSSDDHLQMVH